MILDFDPSVLVKDSSTFTSSYCYIVRTSEVRKKLLEVYGRSGLCLKIMKDPLGKHTRFTFGWGKVHLGRASIIQNIFARCGIAPRVYDLIEVNGHAAQVTEFAKKNGGSPNIGKLKILMEEHGILSRKSLDVGNRNWVGNKFVDFSGFYFADRNHYVKNLVESAHTRRGKNIGVAYQGVHELEIRGSRDFAHRVKQMGLESIDFSGKTVLDIGCNLGNYSRLADREHAKRVVGVDRIADLSFQVSNLFYCFNIDFIKARLPDDIDEITKQSGIEKFDIVFCMAVIKHVGGFAPWLKDLCSDLLVFEGHGNISSEVYKPVLTENFRKVDFLGNTHDNYKRAVFICRV